MDEASGIDLEPIESRRLLERRRALWQTMALAHAPMEPALFLYDGPLDGLEISALDLSADVVVPAACHAGKRATSARGLARLPADAVYGLQAAVHAAGAQSIFGSLWVGDDDQTSLITESLHTAPAPGDSIIKAFRKAITQYRAMAGPIFRTQLSGPLSLLQHSVRRHLDLAMRDWLLIFEFNALDDRIEPAGAVQTAPRALGGFDVQVREVHEPCALAGLDNQVAGFIARAMPIAQDRPLSRREQRFESPRGCKDFN